MVAGHRGLQLRSRQRQQGAGPCGRREPFVLGHLRLSAARDPRLRSGVHRRLLRLFLPPQPRHRARSGPHSAVGRHDSHQPPDAPRTDRVDNRHPDGNPAPAQSAVQARHHPRHDQDLHARSAAAQGGPVYRPRAGNHGQGLHLPQGVHQPGQHRQEARGDGQHHPHGPQRRNPQRHRPQIPHFHGPNHAFQQAQERQ